PHSVAHRIIVYWNGATVAIGATVMALIIANSPMPPQMPTVQNTTMTHGSLGVTQTNGRIAVMIAAPTRAVHEMVVRTSSVLRSERAASWKKANIDTEAKAISASG